MKKLHTSIVDTLSNFLSIDESSKIAFNALEFGYNSKNRLRFMLYDELVDYFSESKAFSIANQAIKNI
jgi:hypothetical protein